MPGPLQKQASAFTAIGSVAQMAALFHTDEKMLSLHALKPAYHSYEIPKASGSFRLIEDPHTALKKIQRHINARLQALYYTLRPAAVYGFCYSLPHEEERNVVNNARRHCGNAYMLNLDLKDFFHSITDKKVSQLFKKIVPRAEKHAIDVLTRLTTYRQRLPMGAPTSPALSNFAMLAFDHELEQWAKVAGITYTRYADDLTFSSPKPVSRTDEKFIDHAIINQGFAVQENKRKRFLPADTKIVTGLRVMSSHVDLPENYLPLLHTEIERLKTTLQVEGRYRTGMSYRKLKLFKQELQGKINFAGMALGNEHEKTKEASQRYDDALQAAENFESANWLDIPYIF